LRAKLSSSRERHHHSSCMFSRRCVLLPPSSAAVTDSRRRAHPIVVAALRLAAQWRSSVLVRVNSQRRRHDLSSVREARPCREGFLLAHAPIWAGVVVHQCVARGLACGWLLEELALAIPSSVFMYRESNGSTQDTRIILVKACGALCLV
jgi:hypothetical protein